MFTLMLYDLKACLRDRAALALLIALPLSFVLLVAYGLAPRLEGDTFLEPFAVAVVDEDNEIETRLLIGQLTGSAGLSRLLEVVRLDEAGAMELLRQDRVAGVVVIPKGFVDGIRHGDNRAFTVVGNPRRPLQALVLKNLMQSAADLVTAAQSGVNTTYHYLSRAGASRESLDYWFNRSVSEFTLQSLGRTRLFTVTTVSATGAVSTLEYYSVALGTVVIMMTGLIGLHLIGADQEGILRRLWAHGLSTTRFVIAKSCALAVLVLLQLAVTLSVPAWFLHGSFRGDLPWAVAVVVATATAVGALLVLIGSVARNAVTANLAALIVIAVSSLAGGSILPEPYLPPFLNCLGWLSINKWAVLGLTGTLFSAEHHSAWQSIAALAAIAAVSVAVAGRSLGRAWR